MTSFKLLIIMMMVFSVGIISCNDHEEATEPVIETPIESTWITVTPQNFYEYFYIDLILPEKLPNGYYTKTIHYTIQFKTREGVIVESAVAAQIEIFWNVTVTRTSPQSEESEESNYVFPTMQIEYHHVASELRTQVVGHLGFDYIKHLSYHLVVQGVRGEVSLDSNYHPPVS